MKFHHIVAVSDNQVIGRDGGMPWHYPRDLDRFQSLTWGHPVVMGRVTFESIGAPLPHRTTCVLTSKTTLHKDGRPILHRDDVYTTDEGRTVASLFASWADVQTFLDDRGAHDVYIAGGASVYQQTLPAIHTIRMTRIHETVDGDTFYPSLDTSSWVCSYREAHESMTFLDYARSCHDT